MTRVGETNLIVSGGISRDFLIYITTKTFEEKINCHCIDESYVRAQEFTPKFIDNTVPLPSDVVDYVICLLRDLGWETVFLLDIMGPLPLLGKKFQLYIAVKKRFLFLINSDHTMEIQLK